MGVNQSRAIGIPENVITRYPPAKKEDKVEKAVEVVGKKGSDDKEIEEEKAVEVVAKKGADDEEAKVVVKKTAKKMARSRRRKRYNQHQLRRLKWHIKLLNARIGKVTKKLDNETDSSELLDKEIASINEKINKIKEDGAILDSEYTMVEEELADANDTYNTKREDHDRLSEEIERLQQKIDIANNNYDRARMASDDVNRMLSELSVLDEKDLEEGIAAEIMAVGVTNAAVDAAYRDPLYGADYVPVAHTDDPTTDTVVVNDGNDGVVVEPFVDETYNMAKRCFRRARILILLLLVMLLIIHLSSEKGLPGLFEKIDLGKKE